MMEFLGIFLALFAVKNCTSHQIEENTTIGDTKIVDGIEYFNIGTLYDEDNWIEVGSTLIQFYVNVYKVNEHFIIKIEVELNEEAVDFMDAYDYAEAEKYACLLTSIYID